MIPNRIGAPIKVVPLTHKWNKKGLPLEANGEEPVPNIWFYGGSVEHQVLRPAPVATKVDTKPKRVKPRKLNPLDFMRGGDFHE